MFGLFKHKITAERGERNAREDANGKSLEELLDLQAMAEACSADDEYDRAYLCVVAKAITDKTNER